MINFFNNYWKSLSNINDLTTPQELFYFLIFLLHLKTPDSTAIISELLLPLHKWRHHELLPFGNHCVSGILQNQLPKLKSKQKLCSSKIDRSIEVQKSVAISHNFMRDEMRCRTNALRQLDKTWPNGMGQQDWTL